MTFIAMRGLSQFVRAKLEGREKLRGILTNVSWLFADQILRMGLGLVVGVWIARYLGSEQFGLFSYAIAFVTLFSTFSTLGLPAIVVRDLVNDPAAKAETLGTAFILRLVGTGLMFCLVLGTIFYLRSDTLTRSAVAIVAAGSFFQTFDTIDYWFQSQVQSKNTVYAKNFAFLCLSVVKVILLLQKAPLIAFVYAALAESMLTAIGLIVLYRMKGERLLTWRFRRIRARQLLSSGWLLMLSGLMIMVYLRVDQIMLGQMKGNREVGIYSAAVKLTELWYFIPMAIVSSVFPTIVMAKKTNSANYSARMQQLLTGMALLGYAVAIPATCLSQKIVHLVFGSQFDGAAPSLIVLAWAGVFVGIGVARESWLITEGLMKFSLIYTALGAVTNIALNFALIPRYGSVGSSTATLISYATAGFAAGFLNPKTRPVAVMTFKALTLQSFFVRSIAGASPIVDRSGPQASSGSELSEPKPLEAGA